MVRANKKGLNKGSLPELSSSEQTRLNSFLSDTDKFYEYRIGHKTFRNLLTIDDSHGNAMLKMKPIAYLPSCEGLPQKLSGWFMKSNFFLESSEKEAFASAYMQISSSVRLFSESCEELLCLCEEDMHNFSINGSNYKGRYSISTKGKLSVAIFDAQDNCQLYVRADDRLLSEESKIFIRKNLEPSKKTCLSAIALLPEMNYRLDIG
ncbi:hypothetical protein STSP2_00222 [Anaerohalosphaera lusitana]|uniref:Uncharacterized protein n=1 Tax=Anaerohalosphaera lusitana TaxID=1936003 RepID=A0A1U9NGL7_9BACT|nr:hypothetical protein [Anaerohalosphaera lusitana]AQT67082.1 hypothetical protein STSP2_00222 [Anaerohalosphaera lusitana]